MAAKQYLRILNVEFWSVKSTSLHRSDKNFARKTAPRPTLCFFSAKFNLVFPVGHKTANLNELEFLGLSYFTRPSQIRQKFEHSICDALFHAILNGVFCQSEGPENTNLTEFVISRDPMPHPNDRRKIWHESEHLMCSSIPNFAWNIYCQWNCFR